jgi:hypothetical protein
MVLACPQNGTSDSGEKYHTYRPSPEAGSSSTVVVAVAASVANTVSKKPRLAATDALHFCRGVKFIRYVDDASRVATYFAIRKRGYLQDAHHAFRFTESSIFVFPFDVVEGGKSISFFFSRRYGGMRNSKREKINFECVVEIAIRFVSL